MAKKKIAQSNSTTNPSTTNPISSKSPQPLPATQFEKFSKNETHQKAKVKLFPAPVRHSAIAEKDIEIGEELLNEPALFRFYATDQDVQAVGQFAYSLGIHPQQLQLIQPDFFSAVFKIDWRDRKTVVAAKKQQNRNNSRTNNPNNSENEKFDENDPSLGMSREKVETVLNLFFYPKMLADIEAEKNSKFKMSPYQKAEHETRMLLARKLIDHVIHPTHLGLQPGTIAKKNQLFKTEKELLDFLHAIDVNVHKDGESGKKGGSKLDQQNRNLGAPAGLWVLGSKFTHSCEPNCVWSFKSASTTGCENPENSENQQSKPLSSSFNLTYTAIRPIKKGEILSFAYCGDGFQLLAGTTLRRKLLRHLQFVCNCNRCSRAFDKCRSIRFVKKCVDSNEEKVITLRPKNLDPKKILEKNSTDTEVDKLHLNDIFFVEKDTIISLIIETMYN